MSNGANMNKGTVALKIVAMLIISIITFSATVVKADPKQVNIVSYKETFINWPGFEFPVGIKIELEVPKSSLPPAHIATYSQPAIWMGPENLAPIGEINAFNLPGFAILKPLQLNDLDPKLEPNAASNRTFLMTYYLYPGNLRYIESANAFCKSEGSNASILAYVIEPVRLHGTWYWHDPRKTINLTSQFSTMLQKQSTLARDPNLWVNMHSQFEDDKLLEAGYKACQLQADTHCFCKP
jgi:hypothetical protein